jgi:hypothetical protein
MDEELLMHCSDENLVLNLGDRVKKKSKVVPVLN